MKRKILIFSLCCALLLGVFSLSVYAADEKYSSNTFVFDLVPDLTSGGSLSTNTFTSNGITFKYITIPTGQGIIKYKQASSDEDIIVYSVSDGWLDDNYRTIVTSKSQGWIGATEGLCKMLERYGNFLTPHSHSYSSTVVFPTHADKGYTLYTCECGDTYKDNYVNALGHNYTSTTVESTCTKKGYTTYSCSCGHTYTEESAVLGHKYTSTTVESTCSKKGSITYICSLCNHSYSESLPTKQHTFVEKNCSACGALNPDFQVKSKDFATVITSMGKQLSVKTVVGVLGVVALACVGLVFMWFAVRKVISIFMKAFRKGKISI